MTLRRKRDQIGKVGLGGTKAVCYIGIVHVFGLQDVVSDFFLFGPYHCSVFASFPSVTLIRLGEGGFSRW